MAVTIRLTKIEREMLKEFQKKGNRHKKGLEENVRHDIIADNRK